MFSGARRVDFSCRDRFAYQKCLRSLRRAISEERSIIVREVAQDLKSFKGSDSERLRIIQAHPAFARRLAVDIGNPTLTRQEYPILAAMTVRDCWIWGFGNYENNRRGHEFWFSDYEGPKDQTGGPNAAQI
jgi:hypothetical protein